MNKASKYIQYLKKINLLSTNILIQQNVIQKHEFSTRISPLIYLSSCLKTLRHASNTSQKGYSNTLVTNDVLLSSILKANKTSDILEMLRLHNSVMTTPQHLQALHSLFNLYKSKSNELSKEEITRSPEFTALCHKLLSHSRNLELKDVMNCVKCLSYLGVSVNSNIMQIMLQLISKMINDMSLHQITFLHFLLKELSSCPLVDALKLALPIVFETQVQYKLEDNVYFQVEFLNYITKQRLSQGTYDFVMSKIIRNIDQLNFKMVKSLLLSLYYKDYSTDKYINVVNKCLNIYLDHIGLEANVSDIEALLARMINKYLYESEEFYNEEFINKVIAYLMKKKMKFEEMGYILKKLNKFGYVNRELLDYMTTQLTNNHSILERSRFSLLLSYIGGCANANHIPPGFNELKPYIFERLNIQKDVLQLPWLIVAFDLAVLDCWSEELLERVFSRNFLYGFLQRSDNLHDYIMLLKLYQATVTLYPGGYKGSLPPVDIIEKAIDMCHSNTNNFPLKAALEHGLGGEDYVLTGVRSKLGHFIDHLVVMRPGGYSVAIKKKIKDKSNVFLENIESNDNLIIGIFLYKPNNYVINLNCLRGPYTLTNKTIEALGIVVLPISMDVWNGLIDYEKIPYVMRELKSISDLKLITEKNVVH